MDSVVIILAGVVIACAGLVGLWLLNLIARSSRVVQVGLSQWLLGWWLWNPFTATFARLRRRLLERIVVGQISAVVRQNLPLATGLALAADSERGWVQTHLWRISKLLAQGLPLSEAMRLGFPDCSSLVVSLVAAGERAGQLPAALEQAEQYLIERARRKERLDVSVWPYLGGVLAMMIMMVAGIMIAVVPKFKEIFMDFGAELPGMTVMLISISDWFVQGKPPGWLVLLIPIPIIVYASLRPRRFPDIGSMSRLADWIRWRLPGLRRMEFGQGMSVMLRLMRLAVRSGMNLEPAARLATDVDVNTQLRGRMTRFADSLAKGMNVGEAGTAAGLGSVATTALASGQRAGDMDAALRYAADYHEAIVSRWWIMLSRVAWPISTLALATVVGFVILSLFMPLIALINSVTVW